MALSKKAEAAKDIRTGFAELQHRHFATIAAIIRAWPQTDGNSPYEQAHIAEHFADELHKTNPKFDRERFITACLG